MKYIFKYCNFKGVKQTLSRVCYLYTELLKIQIKLSAEFFNSIFAFKTIQLCCQTLILPQPRLINI